MQTKKRNKGLILTVAIMTAVTVAVVACAVGAVFFNKSPAPPVTHEHMKLHTDGRDLKNANGEVVLLKGVNAGGLFVQENWMCPTDMNALTRADEVTLRATLAERFGAEKARALTEAYQNAWWTEQDFDNVVAAGLNMVRLPFGYFDVEDDDGNITHFQKLDWFVSECAKREIYLILDLHAAYGSQNGKDHSGDISGARLFDSEEDIVKTVSLWTALAEHYKGEPVIAGFDIINEPEGTEGYTTNKHWDVFDRIYRAIRERDPERIVIIESVWEVWNLPDPDLYGWENVVYSYHNYCWDDVGSTEKQNRFTDSKLLMYKGHCDVPIFVGEFTLFEQREAWEYALDGYESNGISYAFWTYKVCSGGMSSWGLYSGEGDGIVDPVNDSYEEILRKWNANVTSESTYKYNDLYKNLFTKEN